MKSFRRSCKKPELLFKDRVVYLQVHVLDHCTDKCFVTVFDRIFICNGHYTKPQYPRIDGMELFQGCKMHSHIYREPQKFKGKFCNRQNVTAIKKAKT